MELHGLARGKEAAVHFLCKVHWAHDAMETAGRKERGLVALLQMDVPGVGQDFLPWSMESLKRDKNYMD